MALYKVKDHENLVKNTINNSVINTDMQEYNSYVERYRQAKQQTDNSKKIETMEQNLHHISSEINEIKELLKKLV